jgi:primase-polymerase (primpol)-like protein
MRELPPALAAMGAYRQFIVYVAQPSRTRPGKTDKFPADFRSGRVVSAHDPAFWTDHATAIAAATQFGGTYGVGFVFTEADPFWFLDLDGCLLPDGSDWSRLQSHFAGPSLAPR